MAHLATRRFRGAALGPMPQHLVPMLATLADLPPDSDPYAFEYKWDGVRALAYWDGRRLRLESRNLLEITGQYPEIAPLGLQLGPVPAVLDGEIVAIDPQGRVSFSLLQRRMHVMGASDVQRRIAQAPIAYMIFDLIYWDGQYLIALPYRQRRELLEGLGLRGPAWQTGPSFAGEGPTVLASARELGMEGVMAKRLDSPYTPGRRSEMWLKIKLTCRQEVVIGGWMPLVGTRTDMVGALLVGYYDRPPQRPGDDPGRLIYAGAVGTGYSDRDRALLAGMLQALARPTSPFANRVGRPHPQYVEPILVAEVEFREWTHLGTLRHGVFKGLRADKTPREVVKEEVAH